MNAGDNGEDLTLDEGIVEIPRDDTENEVAEKLEKRTEAPSEVLLEFLELAVQQILHARRLYPKEIFLPRRKYNVPVHTSCHPGLNQYVNSTLSSLKKLLQEDRICKVSVLILDGAKPLENFVFEIKMLKDQLNKGEDFIKLEQGLRSFMLKIISSAQSLGPVPETCSFEIIIGCSSDCEVDLNIQEEDEAIKWSIVDEGDFSRSLKPETLLPVKTLTEVPCLKLQLVIEQME